MMVPIRGGRYLPFEEGRQGVVHECVPLHREAATLTNREFRAIGPHRLESDGEPKTRRTACWWCGERVYYHTNGNGDSVLFDELGSPWPVHGCWELYSASRSVRVHPFLEGLAGIGGFGVQPVNEWPEGVGALNVTEQNQGQRIAVSGYIYGWSTIGSDNQNILHNSSNIEAWTRFRVVASGGVGCPVWVPVSMASQYRLNDLVEFVCRLVPWGPRWYLVALRATVLRYAGSRGQPERLARIGRKVRCRYCGRPLNREGVDWGIDRDLRPECRGCHDFRGDRTPEEFYRNCLRVAMHGRGRPGDHDAAPADHETRP